MEDTTPNSICNSCYAQQGRYRFSVVRNAQQARLALLKRDPTTFFTLMLDFIQAERLTWFRVHDSGDFYSLSYIHLWTLAVASCPETRFWFPTRGWVYPNWLPSLRILHSLSNACVRPSAIHFDDEPPPIDGLGHATVSMNQTLPGIYDCPKARNHTTCGTERCRTCWDDTTYVNYRPHGHILQRHTPLTIGATC